MHTEVKPAEKRPEGELSPNLLLSNADIYVLANGLRRFGQLDRKKIIAAGINPESLYEDKLVELVNKTRLAFRRKEVSKIPYSPEDFVSLCNKLRFFKGNNGQFLQASSEPARILLSGIRFAKLDAEFLKMIVTKGQSV